MACLVTLVNAAMQRLVAGKTAGDLSNVARNVTANFVSAVTPFLCEDGAWRTLQLTMACVLHLQYIYQHIQTPSFQVNLG